MMTSPRVRVVAIPLPDPLNRIRLILGATVFIAVATLLFVAMPSAGAQDRSWLDQKLLPAAKKEGALVVYGSMNEQEALPYYKIFEEATGVKVTYVRSSDTGVVGRIAVESRAKQNSWDVVMTTPVNRLPDAVLAQIDPPEAKGLIPQARGANKRWYGVYANYNSPAYNTKFVKREQLPKTYEEFAQRKEWAGKVAIDGTDNEWLKAIVQYYGEQKGVDVVKAIVAALRPVVTDGHLALARATGAGEYWVSLNNYVNLSMNVKLAGNPIDVFALDPVTLFFGQVGVNAKAPHPNAARLAANFMLSQECQQFLAKFGRLPTRKDVPSNPPGLTEMLTQKKVITVLMSPDEERKWQRQFDQLFKGR